MWYTKKVSPERDILHSTTLFKKERMKGKRKRKEPSKVQRQLKQTFDALEEEFISGAKDPKWVAELWDVMIHRNPIELNRPLADQLITYPWSSYPAYINLIWLH